MQELINKRAYNAKHFEKSDGSFIAEIHAGHIHYKEGEEYKPIDWTLVFDEVKRGWGFNTHSFNPFFPEYSTEFAEFRDRFHDKDQIVRYKPIGTTVKGELIDIDPDNPGFDDNPDNKGVIYRDTFGNGLDYMLYNTRSSMVKVAIINDPKAFTKDAVFEWELEFPDKEIFRVDKKEDAEEMTAKKTKTNTEDGKLVGYKLEKRDGKNLDTNKLTLIGNSKLDGKEWFTYLKSFKAWDSEGNTIEIVARISFVNGKAILKKTIPLEFLQSANGKVFTDTTTSFYGGTSDGFIGNTDTGWATTRNATTGDDAKTNQTVDHPACHFYATGQVLIYRVGHAFDTSSIPDTDEISSASFYFYSDYAPNDNSNLDLALISRTDFSLSSTSNFDDFGTSEIASRIDLTGLGTGYKSFSLNSSGLAAISKTGNTAFGLRLSADIDNSPISPLPPATNQFNSLGVRQAEYTGTSSDPYLSVTYSSVVLSQSPSSSVSPSVSPSSSVSPSVSPSSSSSPSQSPSSSASPSVSSSPSASVSPSSSDSPSISNSPSSSPSSSQSSSSSASVSPSSSVSPSVSSSRSPSVSPSSSVSPSVSSSPSSSESSSPSQGSEELSTDLWEIGFVSISASESPSVSSSVSSSVSQSSSVSASASSSVSQSQSPSSSVSSSASPSSSVSSSQSTSSSVSSSLSPSSSVSASPSSSVSASPSSSISQSQSPSSSVSQSQSPSSSASNSLSPSSSASSSLSPSSSVSASASSSVSSSVSASVSPSLSPSSSESQSVSPSSSVSASPSDFNTVSPKILDIKHRPGARVTRIYTSLPRIIGRDNEITPKIIIKKLWRYDC